MSFRPEAIRGVSSNGGVVDYRLTRQAVVRDYRKGRLSRLDVCDAHPELQRAAAGAGAPTSEPCPICEEEAVVLVTYAFGPRLPAGGCSRSAVPDRLVPQASRESLVFSPRMAGGTRQAQLPSARPRSGGDRPGR